MLASGCLLGNPRIPTWLAPLECGVPVEWTAVAERVAVTAGAALVTYLVVAWLVAPILVRAVETRNPRNRTLPNALWVYARAVGVALAAVAAIVAAGYGYVLSASAVVLAAVTLAVGVAGQEVFANVVSGAFLVANRNFNVGDWVVWSDGDGGVVEVVGFRSTRVRTAENEIVTVPNAELATQAVWNPYVRGRYRTSVAVDVAYDADLTVAREAMLEAAAGVERVLESPPPDVLAAFGEGTVRLELRTWLDEPAHADVVRARSELTLAVRDALTGADVEASPAPAMEVSGRLVVDSDDS